MAKHEARGRRDILASTMKIPYTPPTLADFRRAMAEVLRRNQERLRDPAFRAQVDRARDEAAAVARMLKARFGATRVRLHGSLARLDCSEDFDIDMAVEGIEARRFFEALDEAERLVSRKLDLIDLKDATDLMRKRVQLDGVDLP